MRRRKNPVMGVLHSKTGFFLCRCTKKFGKILLKINKDRNMTCGCTTIYFEIDKNAQMRIE